MYRLLFSILLFIPFSYCQLNFTYVLSPINSSTIESYLQVNTFLLTNTSYVTRLSTSGVEFLNSMQILLTANDTQSIVVNWNTGDCSFPSALAVRNGSINISSPICFTTASASLPNLLHLTITSEQLANSAAIYMNTYSLTYFSILLSSF